MASSVSSISSGSSASALADASTRIPSQVLGQQDFLNLLVAQLSAQDPMNPKKDTDFIAQMAQFSALEQSKDMKSSLAAMSAQQDLLQANALLGREVNLQINKDTSVTGVVSAVNIEAGTPKIVVNGTAYEMGKLISVSEAQPEAAMETSTP